MNSLPKHMGFGGVVTAIPKSTKRSNFDTPIDAQSFMSSIDDSSFAILDVNLIDVSPYQPRIEFDEASLQSLADSIAESSQSTPIIVRPLPSGRYELVGGERRLRACKLLKSQSIECLVKKLTDEQAAIFAVIDNDSRQDLSDYEKGRSYKKLLENGIAEHQKALGKKVGLSNATITRCLAYLKLPNEVLSLLDQNPNFLGGRVVPDFVAMFQDGHSSIVVKHVLTIFNDGVAQDVALRNARSEIKAQENPKSPVQPNEIVLTTGDVAVATLRLQGKRDVFLKCEKGVDPEKIMKVIQDAISNYKKSLSISK